MEDIYEFGTCRDCNGSNKALKNRVCADCEGKDKKVDLPDFFKDMLKGFPKGNK